MDNAFPFDVMAVQHGRDLIAALNEQGADFCLIDLKLAHSMLDRAATTRSMEVRMRNIWHARDAYFAVRSILDKLTLTSKRKRQVESLLEDVRLRLSHAGMAVP